MFAITDRLKQVSDVGVDAVGHVRPGLINCHHDHQCDGQCDDAVFDGSCAIVISCKLDQLTHRITPDFRTYDLPSSAQHSCNDSTQILAIGV